MSARHPVDNHLVMRYRKATGLPVLGAKQRLEKIPVSEQLDYVVAAESNPPDGIVADPLEQDEVAGPIIRRVIDSIAERVRREHDEEIAEMRQSSPDVAELFSRRTGSCHRIWREAKQELLVEHGIEWRSPADMNPQVCFD